MVRSKMLGCYIQGSITEAFSSLSIGELVSFNLTFAASTRLYKGKSADIHDKVSVWAFSFLAECTVGVINFTPLRLTFPAILGPVTDISS